MKKKIVLQININEIGKTINLNNPEEVFGVNEDRVTRIVSEMIPVGDFQFSDEIKCILGSDKLNDMEKLFAIFKAGAVETNLNNDIYCPTCGSKCSYEIETVNSSIFYKFQCNGC